MIINNSIVIQYLRDFKSLVLHCSNEERVKYFSKKSITDDDFLIYALCLAIGYFTKLERHWKEDGKQD